MLASEMKISGLICIIKQGFLVLYLHNEVKDREKDHTLTYHLHFCVGSHFYQYNIYRTLPIYRNFFKCLLGKIILQNPLLN